MTNCLGKRCSFGLQCVSFVDVYQSVFPSFPFGFEDGMWELNKLISGNCIYFFSLSVHVSHHLI